MRPSLLASTLLAVFGLATARLTPATADPVKIGVLTDMSGVSSDGTGRGSVEAVWPLSGSKCPLVTH